MSSTDLYASWYMWLGIAGAIVVVAAGLLITVWLAARRILKLALQALDLVKQIQANTNSVWELQTTNRLAGEVLETAQSIREHAGQVAEALHAADAEQV